jgi:DNA-binding NarL/FixJ family response regulator
MTTVMALMERTRTDDLDLRVVEPTDTPEVLGLLLGDVPDVVVVTIQPAPVHPLQLCREVADRAPVSRVLVQATPDQAAHSYQAIRVGAWGVLDPADDVHAAAEAAARGEAVLPARHAAWVLRELEEPEHPAGGTAPSPDRLTAAERTVLRLLAEGATTDTIADHLAVSPRVVGRHAGSAVARLHRRYRRPSQGTGEVTPLR